MSDKKNLTLEDYSLIARNITDRVWQLLDKEEVTSEEADQLIHAAHAARFHLGEIGTPLDIARSEWHLSRAYLKVGRPVPAYYYGQKCLEVCRDKELGPFTISYAYETLARTAQKLEDEDAFEEYIGLAKRYGKMIENEDEKKIFFTDLALVPGYED
ncbi:hypothetical protein HQ587_03415 [bacterium]|nr:hypothetical protein [bacterium]